MLGASRVRQVPVWLPRSALRATRSRSYVAALRSVSSAAVAWNRDRKAPGFPLHRDRRAPPHRRDCRSTRPWLPPRTRRASKNRRRSRRVQVFLWSSKVGRKPTEFLSTGFTGFRRFTTGAGIPWFAGTASDVASNEAPSPVGP